MWTLNGLCSVNRRCGPWTPHGQVMCVTRVRSLAQNPDRTSREGRKKESSKGLCRTTNNWTFKTCKCSLRNKRDCVELELGCTLGREIGLLKGKLSKSRIPVEQEFCVNVRCTTQRTSHNDILIHCSFSLW